MSLKLYYQYCVVPRCENNTKRTPTKLFISVPRQPELRKQWLNLARRDRDQLSPNTTMYFCEDHFDLPNDMENYIQYKVQGSVKKIRMKKGCLPSRFDCQPGRKSTAPSTTCTVFIKKQRNNLVQEALKEYVARTVEISEATDLVKGTVSLQDLEVLQARINPVNIPPETKMYQGNKPRVQATAVNLQIPYYCNVKEELLSDVNDQLTPTKAALWLTQGAQQEDNLKQQTDMKELYAGHVIKEELVIGPEELQKTDCNVTSEEFDTGVLCPGMLHSDIQLAKNDKSIEIYKEMEDCSTLGFKVECDKAFEVGMNEARNKENDEVDLKVSESRKFKIIQHSADSLNLLKDNTVNSVLNLTTHFVCSECEFQTVSSKYFQKHLRLHDNNRPFVCDSCGLRFNSKQYVLQHINRTHRKYKCSGNSSLKRHIRKLYLCTYCNYRCKQGSTLKEHLRIHTGEKPYTCTNCKYKSNRSSDLKRHLRIHSGEKPYTCTYCNNRCGESSALKKHLRIHTGEKPYTCTNCNYMCGTRYWLNKHLKIHTGKQLYTCTYCNYSCSKSSTIKEHLRQHTGDKPYTCTYIATPVV